MRNGLRGWWSMALGAALFLWGAGALAQIPGGGNAPTYGEWFSIVIGVLVLVVGAYFRGAVSSLKETIDENKMQINSIAGRITETRSALDREYHNKQEANAQFNEIKMSISALHRRLDYMRVPVVPGIARQDDGG